MGCAPRARTPPCAPPLDGRHPSQVRIRGSCAVSIPPRLGNRAGGPLGSNRSAWLRSNPTPARSPAADPLAGAAASPTPGGAPAPTRPSRLPRYLPLLPPRRPPSRRPRPTPPDGASSRLLPSRRPGPASLVAASRPATVGPPAAGSGCCSLPIQPLSPSVASVCCLCLVPLFAELARSIDVVPSLGNHGTNSD